MDQFSVNIGVRMFAAWIVIGSLACSAQTPGNSEAEGAAAKSHTVHVKLAAQNMQNFFDSFDDAYTWDESAWPKPRRATEPLGNHLKAIDADFVACEEIENVGILTRFRDWNFPEAGYDYIWTNYMQGQRGINNGFISRIPVGAIMLRKFTTLTLPDESKKWFYARDMISVELEPASDVRLTVYVVHLKSKRDAEGDPNSNKWRLAEATGLAKLIRKQLEVDPDAYIVVTGDFNDTPESDPIKTLLLTGLVDPHTSIPADERITYLRKPYRSTIDYMLVSPALAKHVAPGSAKIVGKTTEETGSDHAAVTASFDLPTADAEARAGWKTDFPIKPVKTMLKPRSADKTEEKAEYSK
jgi:endonuclease/exonuclease/phosphatase family metal-dependent hydrolase